MPSNEYVEFRASLQYCLRQFQSREGTVIDKRDLFRNVAERYAVSIKKLQTHLETYYVGKILFKTHSKYEWQILDGYSMSEDIGGPSVAHILVTTDSKVTE